jgi:hypothetical protein
MPKPNLTLTVALLLTALASHADGGLEIDQSCATQTGCFGGDAAGFPVTITSPGSYRLTGNLDLTSEAKSIAAIAVYANFVTLDINGFEIVGPAGCTGSGASISCTSDSGAGITAIGVDHLSVRNGIIRSFANRGIYATGDGTRISDITVADNGLDGILVEQAAVLESCVAIQNGSDGFDVGLGASLRGVTATGNGGDGIEADGDGSVIWNSSSTVNGDTGIRTQSSGGLVVTGTAVFGNQGDGVLTGPGSSISNTASTDNGGRGFFIGSGFSLHGGGSNGNAAADNCGSAPCEALAQTGAEYATRTTSIFIDTLGPTNFFEIVTLTLDAPASGYAVLNAAVGFEVDGTGVGPVTACNIESASPPPDFTMMASSSHDDRALFSLTGQEVFPVGPGATQFRLMCGAWNGEIGTPLVQALVHKGSLVALFVPNRY